MKRKHSFDQATYEFERENLGLPDKMKYVKIGTQQTLTSFTSVAINEEFRFTAATGERWTSSVLVFSCARCASGNYLILKGKDNMSC